MIGSTLGSSALLCCTLTVDTDGLSGRPTGPLPDGTVGDVSVDGVTLSDHEPDGYRETGSDREVAEDGNPNDAPLDGAVDAGADTAPGPDGSPSDADAQSTVDAGCTGKPGPLMVLTPGGFCIDSTEVTRAQYADFLGSNPPLTGQPPECAWNSSYLPTQDWPYPPSQANFPVDGVDWCDAVAYCTSAGKRLCGAIGGGSVPPGAIDTNISQWWGTCSHRGTRAYPYSVGSPDPQACNSLDSPSGGAPVAVASFPGCVGGFPGIFDMSGNVAEWEDSCDPPDGSFATTDCRARGGNFDMGSLNDNCTFHPGYSTLPRSARSYSVGFRCCSP